MIFIDTGAFIARYVTHDSHHIVALEKWQELEDKNLHFVTSNFVIDETITLLSRITENKFAAEKAKLLYTSKALVILRPTRLPQCSIHNCAAV
jgi:predicted nucleic acid-binding protein